MIACISSYLSDNMPIFGQLCGQLCCKALLCVVKDPLMELGVVVCKASGNWNAGLPNCICDLECITVQWLN